MSKNGLSVKEHAKVLWRKHKAKIIAGGIVAGIGILILIKLSLDKEKKEIINIPAKEHDYTLYWYRGNEESSGVPWTLDLPVDNNSTVEEALRGVLDDLNSGKYKEERLVY